MGVPMSVRNDSMYTMMAIKLKRKFIADFVVFGSIIPEIKAMSFLNDASIYQTLNYTKIAGVQLGLLITFGAPSLLFKRVILRT